MNAAVNDAEMSSEVDDDLDKPSPVDEQRGEEARSAIARRCAVDVREIAAELQQDCERDEHAQRA